jgi:hypothetical protein
VADFGTLLEKAISASGFRSLSQFARVAGTSGTTISRCIAGTRPPPLDQLPHWADELKLSGALRAEFIRSGQEAKAMAKAEAAPVVKKQASTIRDHEKRIAALERELELRDFIITTLLPEELREEVASLMASAGAVGSERWTAVQKALTELRNRLMNGVPIRRPNDPGSGRESR